MTFQLECHFNQSKKQRKKMRSYTVFTAELFYPYSIKIIIMIMVRHFRKSQMMHSMASNLTGVIISLCMVM